MHYQMNYPVFDLLDVTIFKPFHFFAIGYFLMIAIVSFDSKIINNWAYPHPNQNIRYKLSLIWKLTSGD